MPNKIIWDIPLVTLLFSNIVIILFAIFLNWDFDLVFFLYWVQTFIILISICIKIIFSKNLKKRFTKSYTKTCFGEKRTVHDIFNIFERFKQALIFFIFMLVFLLFLLRGVVFTSEIDFFNFLNKNMSSLILGIVIFVFCHLISLVFFINNQSDSEKLVGKFMFRIVSMFLFLFFLQLIWGLFFISLTNSLEVILGQKSLLLVIFMSVKTYVDVLAHAKEHDNMVKL
ncbi:MAG TPA: DUF6498-containing protein [archaeon]|mgnify:CR=1 FL=1|jgi:hypothetical protein|nr:DUF6498-containing protein [archaeon]